ncbi:MAG: hypothetical protein DHS20C12_06480 [Pseudohongiella sp.]|nr:MAG: hypothetical protein DHS20C12_06480 [Pseudohongiella sp.]
MHKSKTNGVAPAIRHIVFEVEFLREKNTKRIKPKVAGYICQRQPWNSIATTIQVSAARAIFE